MSEGAYFVYRLEGRDDSSLASLRRHVRGKFAPETQAAPDLHQAAHGTPGGAITLRPSATPNEMRAWRRDAKGAYTRGDGRPPVPWCEVVFAGPKIMDWRPEQGRKWGDHCVSEFERLFPMAKIIEAQLHTRETEWHVHVVAQPRGRDHMGKMRCSKNAMIRSAIEIETGQPLPIGGKRTQKEHRDDCSAIQDAFHRTCGEDFGLRRGVKGSKAKNKKIDAAERLAATQRQLDELTRRRDAELTRIGNFKAALAALKRDRAALDKELAELAKAKADLEKRKAAVAAERKAHIEEYTSRIEKRKAYIAERNAEYAKARDSLIRRRKAVAVQTEVMDACVDADLGIEDARDAIYAIGKGQPMPKPALDVVQERRARAAAKTAKPLGDDPLGIAAESKAMRELAELTKRGTRRGDDQRMMH